MNLENRYKFIIGIILTLAYLFLIILSIFFNTNFLIILLIGVIFVAIFFIIELYLRIQHNIDRRAYQILALNEKIIKGIEDIYTQGGFFDENNKLEKNWLILKRIESFLEDYPIKVKKKNKQYKS
jgi:hypothetical protein